MVLTGIWECLYVFRTYLLIYYILEQPVAVELGVYFKKYNLITIQSQKIN